MKTTEYIKLKIDRFSKGHIFTYIDFDSNVNKKEAIIKALNRMVHKSEIAKLSKGKYYKPEETPFGNLQPSQKQVVKDLLKDNGKIIGYLTGYSIYNQLGLTTQVSNTIQIGKKDIRPNFKRERYTISFIKQKNTINKKNIPILQILDTIRYIKKIPDSNIEMSCIRLLAILKSLTSQDKINIIRLSLKYPPSTRALLGALLDELKEKSITKPLQESLNPITKYKFGIKKVLTNASKWSLI